VHGIADLLGYSPMAISKIGKELEAFELCDLEAHGRSRRFRFVAQGRGLWDRAETLLSSPVKKQHWLVNCHGDIPGILAGLTALSVETDISDDRIPTYAVLERELRDLQANGTVTLAETHDDAIASLEGWAYDPIVLAKSERVDPLSLYLSLRDNPDERVQGALEELLQDVAW
jgi:hypothetical protein